jgi:hypothetical protein
MRAAPVNVFVNISTKNSIILSLCICICKEADDNSV